MARVLSSLVLVFTFTSGASSQRYVVPEATLELLNPKGLKISIPDIDPGVSLVAFHVNINEEFDSLSHGHFAQDIIKKREGKWTYNIPDFRVEKGDTIYYWIYAIVDNLGYHGLDRSYKVTQDNPHGGTPDTLPTPNQQPQCQNFQSSSNGANVPACSRKILLDKRFDSLDGWTYQIQIGGKQVEDEFTVFTKDPSVSWLHDGRLVIKPLPLDEKYNDTFVRNGHLHLPDCTSPQPELCSYQASAYLILPPIMSSRLTSKNIFSFRYGTVEVRAKLPRGDWIVPELWLEPVSGQTGERVVLGLSRGNTDNSDFGGQSLEAGVVGNFWSSMGKKVQDSSWSQDYHIFKLYWTPEQMEFSVDGKDIHRVSIRKAASGGLSVFDKEVYITLGVHVAGSKDFPDGIHNKPWKNTDPKRFVKFLGVKNNWLSTWDENSALHVESVRITSL